MQRLKTAFVIHQIGAVEVQSVPLMAALALRAGHEVIVVEYARRPRKAVRQLAAFAPDIIAYSLCSTEARSYLDLNRALKGQLRFFSLFGGPHLTFTPSFIHEDGVDAICRGEGDLVFPQFLERFGTDAMYEVDNFSFKMDGGGCRENPITNLIEDLDSLPFPARDLVYNLSYFQAQNPVKGFGSGRGCPYNCSYCFNQEYKRLYKGKGRLLRTKSVPYLIREIKDVAARYPLAFVRFYDDNFGADLDWLEEFADRFPKEVGLRVTCYVRPNLVTDRYVKLLKRAGGHAVYTAIECGNERLRNDVLNRHITNEQIIAAGARFKREGIRIYAFNMIGVPGETEDNIMETVRLNQRIGVDFADVSVFQPYPGTQAHADCRKQGLITDDANRFESFYVASILNIDPALRQRIYLLHKVFTLLVDHPRADWIRRFLPRTTAFNGIAALLYRLYYGYFLHRRIYASVVPFWVRLRGGIRVVLSRNRN